MRVTFSITADKDKDNEYSKFVKYVKGTPEDKDKALKFVRDINNRLGTDQEFCNISTSYSLECINKSMKDKSFKFIPYSEDATMTVESNYNDDEQAYRIAKLLSTNYIIHGDYYTPPLVATLNRYDKEYNYDNKDPIDLVKLGVSYMNLGERLKEHVESGYIDKSVFDKLEKIADELSDLIEQRALLEAESKTAAREQAIEDEYNEMRDYI